METAVFFHEPAPSKLVEALSRFFSARHLLFNVIGPANSRGETYVIDDDFVGYKLELGRRDRYDTPPPPRAQG